MKTPAERIRMIEGSLQCWILGWCSLIPPLGLPMFVVAISRSRRIRKDFAGEWNPAEHYLKWGMVLASVGNLLSCCVYFFVLIGVLDVID